MKLSQVFLMFVHYFRYFFSKRIRSNGITKKNRSNDIIFAINHKINLGYRRIVNIKESLKRLSFFQVYNLLIQLSRLDSIQSLPHKSINIKQSYTPLHQAFDLLNLLVYLQLIPLNRNSSISCTNELILQRKLYPAKLQSKSFE